jgi:SAM-dependent methyltransferase
MTSQDAAPAGNPEAGKKDDYVPFATRFRAWWEGVEPRAIVRKGQEQAQQQEPHLGGSNRRSQLIVVDKPTDQRLQSGSPAEVRYRLWSRVYGEGYSLPGGQAVTSRLLRDARILKPHRVLDLGARLGEVTRAVVLQYGANAIGLEADPELAELAMKLSDIRGLKDTAPIAVYDPGNLNLAEQAYDVIIMREVLFTAPARVRLLQQLAAALTTGGRILMMDFALARQKDAAAAEVKAIWTSENISPEPWGLGVLQEACGEFGLHIRHFNDETEAYRQLLVDSWSDFTGSMMSETLDRSFVDVLMEEAEHAKRRLTALNEGPLRYGYFELMKLPE